MHILFYILNESFLSPSKLNFGGRLLHFFKLDISSAASTAQLVFCATPPRLLHKCIVHPKLSNIAPCWCNNCTACPASCVGRFRKLAKPHILANCAPPHHRPAASLQRRCWGEKKFHSHSSSVAFKTYIKKLHFYCSHRGIEMHQKRRIDLLHRFAPVLRPNFFPFWAAN